MTRTVHRADVSGDSSGDAHPRRVLWTAQVDRGLMAALDDWDVHVDDRPSHTGKGIPTTELIDELRGCDVLVCEVDEVGEEVFQKCPKLRAVIACRARPVNVDVKAATCHGVLVCNVPGRNADATADLTMAVLLSCARKIGEAEQWLRAGKWSASDGPRPYARFRGFELAGKILGIIGAGAVGERVAVRARGFGMDVVVHDPYRLGEQLESVGRVAGSLTELLSSSDVVSLHVPLEATTKGLIGLEELALMKRTAILVNVARGPLVDHGALVEALDRGVIAGAALDVFDREPLDDDDLLLRLPNVVLTPHIGGATREVATHQTNAVITALRELTAGRRPANAVNFAQLVQGDGQAGIDTEHDGNGKKASYGA